MARPVPMTDRVGRVPAARSPRRSSSCARASPTSPPSPIRSTASPASSCSTRSGRRAPTSSSRSSSPTPTSPTTQAAIERLKTDGLDDRRPAASRSRSRRHTTARSALVSFTMAGGQNDEANRAIVRQVRDRARRRRSSAACPTSGRYVTGDAAFSVDVTKVYADGIPLIFGFVLGLSFLLMLVAFHSIVIPIKAILLNLLSTAAAYGVLVLVFQRRLVRRAARDHAERGHRELGPAVHLHDPVRAVDGLPPVHPHPDQGGPGPRARLAGGGGARASR